MILLYTPRPLRPNAKAEETLLSSTRLDSTRRVQRAAGRRRKWSA